MSPVLFGYSYTDELNESVIFFLRDFILKKTLFEKLQYLKQEQRIGHRGARGGTQSGRCARVSDPTWRKKWSR